MKKNFFALLCITSAMMFAACGTTPSSGDDNGKTDKNELTKDVIVANLPVNFKATMTQNEKSEASTSESNSTIIKVGADWILSYDYRYEDLNHNVTTQQKTYYLQFDKNGEILKQFVSDDGGNNWSTTDKFLNFGHFAESSSNTGRRLLDKSLKTSYGSQIDLWKATGEKKEVCNRPCTEYSYTKSVYLVDDATHLVFREDYNYPDIGSSATFVVKSWDETIKNSGYTLP